MSRTRSKFEEKHWCDLYDDIIDDEDHEELPNEINGQHNLVHTPDVEVDDVSLNYGVSKRQHRAHYQNELAHSMRRAVNRGGSDNEFVENLEHIREWNGLYLKVQSFKRLKK